MPKLLTRFFHLMLLLLCCASLAQAQEDGHKLNAEEFVASLKFQQGRIKLPGGKASLDLPADFRYLDPQDADRVLSQAWSNPPGAKTLGMILPANVSPLEEAAWGVVITYKEDGHVSDEDADKIDYSALLKDMQESVAEENKLRTKQGYPAMQLLGWAENPHYDKGNHKLYWAKELGFGSGGEHSLNYNVRVLGREGVLVLNAVSSMKQIG